MNESTATIVCKEREPINSDAGINYTGPKWEKKVMNEC